ncbi:NAD(P)-binding protein [Durotheca rogersii]|uniref:NAD(P)-binding protein n=1 Tax=Durotheca rogersii TaxID=419775 RepID=UPI00221FA270|nr:NAD(P)-binding protein [Durotheca rogersii]KAI5860482.1 NAD(P)-binding protein [Durotheca rogersii]
MTSPVAPGSLSAKRTIVFLGGSGGVGLAALTRALGAGHNCVALCRTPAKLTDRFAPAGPPANLRVEPGNAHDAAAIARCLVWARDGPGGPVLADTVVSSIGGVFQLARRTIDDPHVCEQGARALLDALALVRAQFDLAASPSPSPPASEAAAAAAAWRPRIVAVSTCGISESGRDFPLAETPVYHLLLRVPHADKKVMEEVLVGGAAAGAYAYTLVRPSLLTDDAGKPERRVRAGAGAAPAIGYGISRDDAGRWIYENLLENAGERAKYENQVVTITW